MNAQRMFITAITLVLILITSCQSGNPASTEQPTGSSPSPPTRAPSSNMEPTDHSTGRTISVPLGEPASIDGVISPGEWDQAISQRFSDDSELLLMGAGGYLYLGIRAITPEMIVANIFIEQDGEIEILHTSAALGTARYQRQGSVWLQIQDFMWRCRNASDSQAALDERAVFFQQEHWISTNSRIGTPNELEIQVEIPSSPVRLAANVLRSSDPSLKVPWPSDLNDDCIRPTPGGLPEQLVFDPVKWVTVFLSFTE